jgi:hypothetical protein
LWPQSKAGASTSIKYRIAPRLDRIHPTGGSLASTLQGSEREQQTKKQQKQKQEAHCVLRPADMLAFRKRPMRVKFKICCSTSRGNLVRKMKIY